MADRNKWWRRLGSKRSGFRYIDKQGVRIIDESQLGRIERLVIPPRWHDVLICPSPKGRIQAVGLDDLGRIQYVYHPQFILRQQRRKYSRLESFGRALPALRRTANEHIMLPQLNREKVLAVVIRLINDLYFRVGNEVYAKRYRTYGITTLRNRHLCAARDGCLVFQFIGKHHLRQRRVLTDPQLAEIVLEIQGLPGPRLFQYLGEDGGPRPVRPTDVNEYIRTAMGDGFTAKDFRVWAGTVLTAAELSEIGPPSSDTAAKRNVAQVIKRVAERLGNTPAVCRSSYVHPAVIDLYNKGRTIADFRPRKVRAICRITPEYEPEEAALLEMLASAETS